MMSYNFISHHFFISDKNLQPHRPELYIKNPFVWTKFNQTKGYNIFKIENTDVKVLNKEFKIDSPDILIKIISELPKRILASNQYLYFLNKCKIKERNLAINNIISN